MERGTRWMEKQEAKSLRMALEDMDLEAEKRIHEAAQDEAAELVYRHQSGEDPTSGMPFPNPDGKRDYHRHLRKGSYQREHVEAAPDITQAHRRSSSGSRRMISLEKKRAFMHPKDRIWEDPQEEQSPPPPPPQPQRVAAVPATITTNPEVPQAHTRRNPFARVRMHTDKLERTRSEPIVSAPRLDSVEIQRNPPSQSRRPWYMSNEPLPPTPPSPAGQPADEVSPKVTPTREGREVRGDDIRAATSKRRSDYSPKLPRPTMVSDKPGRPIVSFQQDWRPKEVVLEGAQAATGSKATAEPSKTRQPDGAVDPADRQPVPSINFPDSPTIPTIVFPDEFEHTESSRESSAPVIPSINIEAPIIAVSSFDEPEQYSGVPSAHQPHSQGRPHPTHAATSPLPMSRPHITPTVRQSGMLCAHCALPIAGRILSASGERFHPSCFVCYQCHTNLELVAFYPEPEKAHLLQREIEDGDGMLRFFCHLDFHELFSPRCKSCKTPIEGEVIVACGAEWHVGHFFCAQCGDPFDSRTPFVEKEGYAWCVGCHTNRFSSKCRKCRKPVVGTVVKALGADWHSSCFVCVECNGEFQDGRYFLRGSSDDPVCVTCEQRRLKA
ncbi:hypothetical protein BDY17DRAFT_248763 [Neohortaea acidophila]|uniref:LIM zinc-binding domain-containing protein n=1 Tax=Neohortaea acidophila TaxID=245834 RepID=A0A6A6PX95_9PEZI|nr:uncharacterized protein BDY17DRAFT_248763 [Neohortaea acidophila]KAF2484381.1 hypothetical protein BDY17DRAFT_248763 [Neohortaea acidophila]